MTKKIAKPDRFGQFSEADCQYLRGIECKGGTHEYLYMIRIPYIEQADGWRSSCEIHYSCAAVTGRPHINGSILYPTKEIAIIEGLKSCKPHLLSTIKWESKKKRELAQKMLTWCEEELIKRGDAETQADTAMDALNALLG